jgi:glycosyltransferase involved in cell wall biosynthesis
MQHQISERSGNKKTLLLFGIGRLSWMMDKGNVWYLRHYEQWFDEVICCYLVGSWPEIERQGATSLISLGSRSPLVDIIMAPWRLYRYARRTRPTRVLTADIVFGWWTSSLLRLFLRMKIDVMPVCILPEIYKSTGRSLSRLPIWLERISVVLTFRSANRVITPKNSDVSLSWLRSEKSVDGRLTVVPCIVDEFPPQLFFERLETARLARLNRPQRPEFVLLYVGRLHHEKKVDGLIGLMSELRKNGTNARLVIAGDGPERSALEAAASSAGVASNIDWLGFVTNERLPEVYADADVFISTVTGTALREAGLIGLPVVAYDIDWVSQLLEHEKTALLVPPGDVIAMAREVGRLSEDPVLYETIASGFHDVALSRWSTALLKDALRETFESA